MEEAKIERIYALYSEGHTVMYISKCTGISRATVYSILKKKGVVFSGVPGKKKLADSDRRRLDHLDSAYIRTLEQRIEELNIELDSAKKDSQHVDRQFNTYSLKQIRLLCGMIDHLEKKMELLENSVTQLTGLLDMVISDTKGTRGKRK